MIDGLRPTQPDEMPDIFVDGMALTITTAPAYVRVKHIALWMREIEKRQRIRLHPWDSWDHLGDRLQERLGLTLWNPCHWADALEPLPYHHRAIEEASAALREQQARAAKADTEDEGEDYAA